MYNGNGNSYGNGSYRRGGIPSTYLYIGAVVVVLVAVWLLMGFLRAGIDAYFALVVGILLVLGNLRDLIASPFQGRGQISLTPNTCQPARISQLCSGGVAAAISPLSSGTQPPDCSMCQAVDRVSSSIGAVGGRLRNAPRMTTAQRANGPTRAIASSSGEAPCSSTEAAGTEAEAGTGSVFAAVAIARFPSMFRRAAATIAMQQRVATLSTRPNRDHGQAMLAPSADAMSAPRRVRGPAPRTSRGAAPGRRVWRRAGSTTVA